MGIRYSPALAGHAWGAEARFVAVWWLAALFAVALANWVPDVSVGGRGVVDSVRHQLVSVGGIDMKYSTAVSLYPGFGRMVPPEGRFVDVSVSEHRSCGVRVSGELVCWGNYTNSPENMRLPEGLFSRVSLSDHGGCAARRDGAVVCWFDEDPTLFEVPLVGALVDMQTRSKWDVMGCGVRADGRLACWDGDVWFRDGLPTGTFTQMVGPGPWWQWCALRADGEVVCWGNKYEPPATRVVPEGLGPFADASLDGAYGCGIGLDGDTVCWVNYPVLERVEPFDPRESDSDEAEVPHASGLPLPRVGLARFARGSTLCAIDSDGRLRGHCGYEPHASQHEHLDGEFVEPPSGRFSMAAIGAGHGCGIRVGGTLACWGYPYSVANLDFGEG